MTRASERQPKPAARPVPKPAVAAPAQQPDAGLRAIGNAAAEQWLGAIDDPLEGGSTAGSAGPSGGAAAPPDDVAALGGLRGGAPLAPHDLAYHSARLRHDLSAVRIHTGESAAGVTDRFAAHALTVGADIVLGPSATPAVLGHELAHVAQQAHAGRAWIQRAPAPRVLKAGDDVAVVVYALTTDASGQPRYSRTYRVEADGTIVVRDGVNTVAIPVAGLQAGDAAQVIADQLVVAELFRGPRVAVTGPGMTSPAYANAKTAMSPDVATAYANFLAYLKGVTEPPDAVVRYYQWITDHRDTPEFLKITPPDLWAQSLKRPERPRDPEAEQVELWIRFINDRLAETKKLTGKELDRAVRTMTRFQDWFDGHRGKPDFVKSDPAKVWADFSVGELKKDIDVDVRAKIEADKQAAASSPAVLEAKAKKFDEFVSTATKLFGFSSRNFPYSIPLDSQGKDILVTGQPSLQKVLNDLGGALIHWGATHMADSNFAVVSVNSVLLNLLQGGFRQRIDEAERVPLEHETIDRNELLGRNVLLSFGETIATGLLAVAVVGLFVGANIITAGGATVILVGLAGYSGVRSYQARRDEIEKSGYEVSIPETMLDSAGDIVGVSQLIEGITGHRLGTGAVLGSEARSSQLGAGAGNVATLLVGSKAYRSGQNLGQRARLALPGEVPAGPNAQIPPRAVEPMPDTPTPNADAGRVELAARDALPENLRPGFDIWSAEMRKNGGNPENILAKKKPAEIEKQAAQKQRIYDETLDKAKKSARDAAQDAARAKDDPLNPILKIVKRVKDSNVFLHWEGRWKRSAANPDGMPWTEAEIKQAVELSKRTGEEVHLFGDTPRAGDYPGIDGTIGNPPRPLSLKASGVGSRPGHVRWSAGQALAKAKASGYSKVEVHIDAPGHTVAQIKAAWDLPSPVATDPAPGPAFEGDLVAKIIIQAKDGQWVQTPPLAGGPKTGVSPTPARPDENRK